MSEPKPVRKYCLVLAPTLGTRVGVVECDESLRPVSFNVTTPRGDNLAMVMMDFPNGPNECCAFPDTNVVVLDHKRRTFAEAAFLAYRFPVRLVLIRFEELREMLDTFEAKQDD